MTQSEHANDYRYIFAVNKQRNDDFFRPVSHGLSEMIGRYYLNYH